MGHERTQGICQSVWRPTAYLLFKREWILMSIGPGASCVVQAAMAGAKACPEPSAKPHGPTRRCRRRGQAPIASRTGATVNRRGVQVIDVLLQRALGGELAVFCVELQGSARVLDRVVRVLQPVGHLLTKQVPREEAQRDAAGAGQVEEVDLGDGSVRWRRPLSRGAPRRL